MMGRETKKELLRWDVVCCSFCKHGPAAHEIVKLPVFRNQFVWRCTKCSCHWQFSFERKSRRVR